jgi:oligopeptide/dipeptide ABC transporter ATP-binding protein
MHSNPSLAATAPPLVEAIGVRKDYITAGAAFGKRTVTILPSVDLAIGRGQTVGLVGESGSGKSTLGRAMIGLLPMTAGSVTIAGEKVTNSAAWNRRKIWPHAQMIFQDPSSSLNPKMTVRQTLQEPLRNFGIARGAEADRLVRSMLDACGLSASALDSYAHHFSGGQRQRIGIARALISRPQFIVADEPVSALDISIQAQIVNLLKDLQQEFSLTYLFIAHDLAVVRHISDVVAVMYLGNLVEMGRAEEVYAAPAHPYTKLLIASVPLADPEMEQQRAKVQIQGEIVSPTARPAGCPFFARCPQADASTCKDQLPALRRMDDGRQVACHFPDESWRSRGCEPTRTRVEAI